MKKILSLALVALLLIVTACSGGGNGGNANVADSSGQTSSNKDKINLKVWTIWPSGYFKPIMDDLVAQWNEENPNIQVSVEATENEAYKTKVRTAAAANELPDIFFTWGAGFSKPFVEGGKVLALDEYLNDGTMDKLMAGSLDNFTYDDKVYALPFTMYVGTFFVNQQLFDEHGLDVPTTYDELLATVKTFREKGIDPLAVGGKDLWPTMFYHNILATREGGVQLNINALNGEASFEEAAFTLAATRLQELANADAFMNGYLGLTRDEAEAMFMTGQIPMYYTGSWFAKTLDAAPELKENIRALNFPIIEGAPGTQDEWLGGIIDTLMVSSSTEHPDEAVAFLKYVTEGLSNGGYQVGAGLPTWTADIDETKIDPLMLEIAKLTENATGIVPVYDLYLEGQQAEVHKSLVAELVVNKITPEEFGARMEALER